jgi:hypothetical protein
VKSVFLGLFFPTDPNRQKKETFSILSQSVIIIEKVALGKFQTGQR